MPHRGKTSTKQVTFDIDPELRDEVIRLTGAKTLTEAVHEALAELVLRERVEAPLRKRREVERRWVTEKGLGLPRSTDQRPTEA